MRGAHKYWLTPKLILSTLDSSLWFMLCFVLIYFRLYFCFIFIYVCIYSSTFSVYIYVHSCNIQEKELCVEVL